MKPNQNESESFVVREARLSDCQEIHSMITELATYEKMLDQVEITVQQLEEDGFGTGHEPRFRSIVVEKVSPSQQYKLVGFLLYVQKYSTFQGPFLWIEDLYVKADYRRRGLGQSLIRTIVGKALEQQMSRIEWNVLGWNQLAIGFYRNKLGAFDMTYKEDWLIYRLPRDRFQQLLNINIENVRVE